MAETFNSLTLEEHISEALSYLDDARNTLGSINYRHQLDDVAARLQELLEQIESEEYNHA